MMLKYNNAYKTIGEVVKILDLKSKKKIITNSYYSFLGKKFKQIKPKILNGNRRYYDEKNIKLLKKFTFY